MFKLNYPYILFYDNASKKNEYKIVPNCDEWFYKFILATNVNFALRKHFHRIHEQVLFSNVAFSTYSSHLFIVVQYDKKYIFGLYNIPRPG